MASLKNAVETVLADYLKGKVSADPVANFYTGFDSDDRVAPAVICIADSAEEDPMRSGNYRVQCRVVVKCIAETDSQQPALADEVKSWVYASDTVSYLQSVGATNDLAVFGYSAAPRVEWDRDQNVWSETHNLEIYCAVTA